MKENMFSQTNFLRNTGLLYVLCLFILCLMSNSLLAKDALKSIAVISQPEIEKSGFTEILTVKLQDISGLSIVERGRLNEIFKEISLTQLLGANNLGNRRKACSLLKADWLIVLRVSIKNNQKILTAIVCDSASGARLVQKRLKFKEDDFEKNCEEIKVMIKNILQKYPNGVEQVVGVSRFISKTLVHDYDYLQSAYANIIETALMSVPGLAVIEFDEAQAVMKENELTASDPVKRTVPFFIEGEYVVNDAVSKKNLSANIAVSISSVKGKIKSFKKQKLKFDEVINFLDVDLTNAIAGYLSSDVKSNFNREQQFQILVSKAEEFEAIGMRKYSVDCRQAALLLKPDSVNQRIKMINQSSDADLRIAHLEYLVRNKLISRDYAVNLIIKVFEGLKPAKKFTFIKKLYPYVKIIPLKTGEELIIRSRLVDFFYTKFSKNILWDGYPGLHESLELICYIHENILPQDLGVTEGILFYITAVCYPNFNNVIIGGTGNMDTDGVKLLKKMTQSSNKSNQMYGKFGLLLHKYSRLKSNGLDLTLLSSEVEEIYKEIIDVDAKVWLSKLQSPGTRQYLKYLDMIKNDIKKYSNLNNGIVDKPKVKKNGYSSSIRAEAITWGRVFFDEITFKIKTKGGITKNLSSWRHHLKEIRKCNESLDVLWSETAVVVMRQPGLLEELLLIAPRQPWIDDVSWDGKHFWVGIKGGDVLLLDTAGNIISKIGKKDGLPPTDNKVAIHNIEENKAIIIGSFSKQQRGWCAIVKVKDGKSDVNVFHEAIVVKGHENKSEEISFSPKWTHEFDSVDTKSRLILVGRSSSKRPLAINVDSLTVSPFFCELIYRSALKENEMVSLDGMLYTATSQKIYKYSEGNRMPEIIDCDEAGYSSYPLIKFNGHVYYPGPRWWRFDSKMQRKESLMSRSLYRKYTVLRYYGVSAHYGIIGWDIKKSFYRMNISDSKIIMNPVNSDYGASLKKYW